MYNKNIPQTTSTTLQQQIASLTSCIERARKVLQHEQRTNHQDQAIKPGGVEAFTRNWCAEVNAICQSAGLDPAPLQHFADHLKDYHQRDPMQRATNLRAALATLNDLAAIKQELAQPQEHTLSAHAPHVPHSSQVTPPRVAAAGIDTPGKRSSTPTRFPAAKEPAPRVASTPASTSASTPRYKKSIEELKEDIPPAIPNPIQLEAGMTPGHTSLTLLSADITAVPGVGPTAANKLRSLGVRTVRDLLYYFPREHRDYSRLEKIAHVPYNELTTTMGLVWEAKTLRTQNGRSRTTAKISDESGSLNVTWFNQPYLLKQLQNAQGNYIVVTGIKQRFGNRVDFNVRSHELPEQGDLLNTGRMVPIYPLTEGLHAKSLRRFTKYVVDRYATMVPDHLPPTVIEMGHLMPLPTAITQYHYPDNEEQRATAQRRLAFDELFAMQLGMQERRSRWKHEGPHGRAFNLYHDRIFLTPPEPNMIFDHEQPASLVPALTSSTLWSVIENDQPLEGTLPFTFTPAQHRVIREIFGDLAKTEPMSRLLQGDVGAGKTAVAAACLLMAALNGYQGAIMAPTELLAEQHARSISKMLEPFGIHTVLLTGSQRQRERQQARISLESGEAAVAIGTHALIQDDVIFRSLGLVIIDEQHRFGVEQRDALRQKGLHPHMLVMTATPIPRTLSLTLYGDLDISIIDQLPPGRIKIITRWRTGTRRNEAYTKVLEQVLEGRQAFIICPLIEESDSLAAKAAVTEYERLRREVFPNQRLGLLHGGMKAAEKDQIMNSFRNHELDILVATSVIEVGIDIPNASVMVIEDADRFGLSQLHQFRGRVGRGKHQSYCYVLSADASVQAQERLGVFQETDDGFKLSEEDLRLRGPGDFIGIRQSGMPEMRIASLSDTVLIEQARAIAERLWQSDPYLRKPEHSLLRERMHLFWQNMMAN
ncbi:DEXHc_RecG and SF2_C_RecG domain-containing protein [Ktedonobacteria bacterium brp13]|nr:DEXHc_RecG and SF2_C_RecG domain-containing protein [Ktedonobacteria bacterium brp13]